MGGTKAGSLPDLASRKEFAGPGPELNQARRAGLTKDTQPLGPGPSQSPEWTWKEHGPLPMTPRNHRDIRKRENSSNSRFRWGIGNHFNDIRSGKHVREVSVAVLQLFGFAAWEKKHLCEHRVPTGLPLRRPSSHLASPSVSDSNVKLLQEF